MVSLTKRLQLLSAASQKAYEDKLLPEIRKQVKSKLTNDLINAASTGYTEWSCIAYNYVDSIVSSINFSSLDQIDRRKKFEKIDQLKKFENYCKNVSTEDVYCNQILIPVIKELGLNIDEPHGNTLRIFWSESEIESKSKLRKNR